MWNRNRGRPIRRLAGVILGHWRMMMSVFGPFLECEIVWVVRVVVITTVGVIECIWDSEDAIIENDLDSVGSGWPVSNQQLEGCSQPYEFPWPEAKIVSDSD